VPSPDGDLATLLVDRHLNDLVHGGRGLAVLGRSWPTRTFIQGTTISQHPHDELVTNRRSLTNLRVARDPSAGTGHKVEPGPFAVWATAPIWCGTPSRLE
jgi:hypothetical protein